MKQLEPIDSTLISHRGHDPELSIMTIRFRDNKPNRVGPIYEYGNVTEEVYNEGLNYRNGQGDLSFGGWFQKVIKYNPKRFPYRKIEDAHEVQPPTGTPEAGNTLLSQLMKSREQEGQAGEQQTLYREERVVDVNTHGQEIPVSEEVPIVDIVSGDIESLKASKAEIETQASALFRVPDGGGIPYIPFDMVPLAGRIGVAVARMRGALEETLRPGIKEKHEAWKTELNALNVLDNPLEDLQTKLRSGIAAAIKADERRREEEARILREAEQKRLDQESQKQAEEIQLSDAVEAEARGETELAEEILQGNLPVPVSRTFAAPVHVPTALPKMEGVNKKAKWDIEWVDEKGNVVEHPRLDLIPQMYHLVDEKALRAMATRLGTRMNIPGVRAHDIGTVAFAKGRTKGR